ncbi:MAG: metal-binding protein [Candidatus Binatia bacterium]
MTCHCKQLPEILDVEEAPKSFEKGLEKIEVEGWVRLMQCSRCGQYWRVDQWDKYQTQFAIKLVRPDKWKEFDSVPLEKEFLVKARGGLTDEKCMWASCNQRRVKGVAYCVDHLYATGARK